MRRRENDSGRDLGKPDNSQMTTDEPVGVVLILLDFVCLYGLYLLARSAITPWLSHRGLPGAGHGSGVTSTAVG